jgi:hypothetical protein
MVANPELMAPIPGMSLAGEPGNVPWEQPPMFVELKDVVKYYTEKLTEDNSVDNLLRALKTEAPVLSIATTIIKTGMMKGVHSIDVGFLAVPVIVELIKTIAEMNDVKYVLSDEDMRKYTEIDESLAQDVIREMKQDVSESLDKPIRKGLMAKGEKE